MGKRITITAEDPKLIKEVTAAYYEIMDLLLDQDIDVDCLPPPNWLVTGV